MSATADVVIVGGGIQGLSVAWHLVRRRPRLRVVVLERQPALATQATSQAAALLTRLRADQAVIPLVDRTYQAIADLETVLGEALPLHRVGTLHTAASPETAATIAHLAAIATAHRLAVSRPPRDEIAARIPWLATAVLADWLHVGDEGFIDPYLLADAYARAARQAGAEIRTGVAVERLATADGRIAGVVTGDGAMAAPVVVIAAGAWANRLTLPVGAALAMAPVRSQYWISAPDPRFPAAAPVVILADARAYARPELGALLFGLREHPGYSADFRDLDPDLTAYAFPDDPGGWQALEDGAPALATLFPALPEIGIRRHVAGFSTYTADGRGLIGRLAAIDGLFVSSGCGGAGIATSGGVGEILAAMVLGEPPVVDGAPFAPDRFAGLDPRDPAFRATCAAARSRKIAG